MAPIVRQCCCGCTLLTGTRIIAIVLIISYAYNIGSNMVNIDKYDDLMGNGIDTWVYIGVAICSILLIANVCLFIATYNKIVNLVLFWICATIMGLFYNVGSVIYVGVEIGSANVRREDEYIKTTVIGSLIGGTIIGILLGIYFIIVVWSWKEELKEEYQQFQNPQAYGPNITVVTSNTTNFAPQQAGYGPPPAGYGPPPAGYGPYPAGQGQPGIGYAPPGQLPPYTDEPVKGGYVP